MTHVPPQRQPDSPDQPLGNPTHWVDEHGDALFRYARMRLPDASAAEDVVQETFLAAIQNQKKFQGQSHPRTWLIGILRHKIGDHYRNHRKELQVTGHEDGDASMDDLFTKTQHFKNPPGNWRFNPQELAQREEFWLVMDECLKGLGTRASEVFSMRVLNDCPADEVCKELKLSSTNLWVLLHRARTKLRTCLEARWFQNQPKPKQES